MPYKEKKIRSVGRSCAIFVFMAGAIILAGWQFRIPLMRGEFYGTFVAPTTALFLMTAGFSILLQSSKSMLLRWVGSVLSVPVFIFALATFIERITGTDFGIDQVFMAHRMSDWKNIPFPGRFSTPTSINFMLTGLCLATLRVPKKKIPSDYFAAGIATVCYFAIIGFIYKATVLYGRVTSTWTVALFVVLAIALWCSSRDLDFARFMSSDLPGGIVARRVVLSILVLMPLLGWVEVQARRAGVVDRELGISCLVVAATTIFTFLVLRTARQVDEIDRRRSKAEAGLIQTEKLAATGRMAATIAHEINNPLGAVTNLLYVVRNIEMDAATRDSYLSMAEDEIRHLSMISKQTLGFYRESSAPTTVDCVELIQQVVALYRSRCANKGIELRLDVDKEAIAWCVSGELRQVLVNLVSNAFDACPNSKGLVRLSASRNDDVIRLCVSDNGHGVKDEDRVRIFEPFFTTKENVGTGLGLWVSKDLMEKNSGSIELISGDLPFQTTFRLTLPAADSADRSATA
jgi:signal transduction histidine kinase